MLIMKAFAEGGNRETVGQNPRARRRQGETEGSVIRRAGRSAFGRVEAINGRPVNNVRPNGRG